MLLLRAEGIGEKRRFFDQICAIKQNHPERLISFGSLLCHIVNGSQTDAKDTLAFLNTHKSTLIGFWNSFASVVRLHRFGFRNDGYAVPTQIVTNDDTPRIAYGVCSLNEGLSEALGYWHQMHDLLAQGQILEEEYRDWQDAFPLQYQIEQRDDSVEKTDEEAFSQQSDSKLGGRYRRKGLLRIRTYEGHLIVMRNGTEISEEQLERICNYVNCSMEYLTDDGNIQFKPQKAPSKTISTDREILYDILDIMDMNADTEIFRIVQIQLSRIVLYHLAQKGIDREQFRSKCFLREKMDFLYFGKKPLYNTSSLGFFYSELAEIRNHTGVSYQEMFTGIK